MDFDTGKLMMFRFYKPMFMGELQMITVQRALSTLLRGRETDKEIEGYKVAQWQNF